MSIAKRCSLIYAPSFIAFSFPFDHRYRDDEDDSDDEVDWGALAEAAKEYQRREG